MRKLIYQRGGFARIEESSTHQQSTVSKGQGYTSGVKCPPPSGQHSDRQTQKPCSPLKSYQEAVPQSGDKRLDSGRHGQTTLRTVPSRHETPVAQGSSRPKRYTVSKHSDSFSSQTWKYLRNFALGCLAFFLAINILYVGAVLVAGNPAKLGFAYSELFGSVYQGFVHGWDSKCYDWYTCEK